jgi:Putative adhesin
MSTLTPLRRAILLVGGLLALGVITVAVLSIVDSLGRTTAERDDTLSTRDGSLIVRNGSGPVDLVPSHDSAVHIHTTMEYGIFHPSVEIAEESGSVTLRSSCRGDWLPMTKCEVRYRIEVPANTKLDVHATTGDISATELTGGTISLQSTAGTIAVDHITASALVLHSNVGDLSAIDISTPNVDARATAGTIMLEFDKTPDKVKAHTTVGDVNIAIPPTAGYDITTSTNAGNATVDSAIPQDASSKHTVDASTTAGDLVIFPATSP